MIDSHAHLDSKEFDDDLEEVLRRFHEKGVSSVVSCGTGLSSSEKNLKLSRRYETVYVAVGVHPHEAYQIDEKTFRKLKEFSRKKKVVAIGETGLDYHYNFSLPEVQRKSLRLHIRLAREVGLPLVIHCRNAETDLIQILKEEKASEAGGVIHSFTGTLETAKACMEFGFYIGASGIITFKNAKELAGVFSRIPFDRILIETDSPYLSPVPFRGKRNEPCFVAQTAMKLAELHETTLENVIMITDENARTLFRKLSSAFCDLP